MICLYGLYNYFINSKQVSAFARVLLMSQQTFFPTKTNATSTGKENCNLPVLAHLEALECSMTGKVIYICELRNLNYTKSVILYNP